MNLEGSIKNGPVLNSIIGVEVVSLFTKVDEGGYLVEILQATDNHFKQFGQVYLVGDFKAGVIRAFKKHRSCWDWFSICHGAAKFVLYDDREDSATYKNLQIVITSERNPSLIVVPPGVYSGWMALSDNTQLISIASEVSDTENNSDDISISSDSFGDVWNNN